MPDRMRAKHIAEIRRLEEAIKRTNSEYLKRDYTKNLNMMKKELREYDRFKANTGAKK